MLGTPATLKIAGLSRKTLRCFVYYPTSWYWQVSDPLKNKLWKFGAISTPTLPYLAPALWNQWMLAPVLLTRCKTVQCLFKSYPERCHAHLNQNKLILCCFPLQHPLPYYHSLMLHMLVPGPPTREQNTEWCRPFDSCQSNCYDVDWWCQR